MLFVEFDAAESNIKLIIEDDGSVAYAYLVDSGKIVADVWLYNRAEAPREAEWKLGPPKNRPFLNAADYICNPFPFEIPQRAEQFGAEWFMSKEKKIGVRVLSNGYTIGEMLYDETPGRAVAARKSGPLAQTFD